MRIVELRNVPEGELFIAKVDGVETILKRGAYLYQTQNISIWDVDDKVCVGSVYESTVVYVD